VNRLREELDREREERNYFQLERDKVNTFWEITKRQLEEKRAELRNKDREMEDSEERHQIEIKVCDYFCLSVQLIYFICFVVTVQRPVAEGFQGMIYSEKVFLCQKPNVGICWLTIKSLLVAAMLFWSFMVLQNQIYC